MILSAGLSSHRGTARGPTSAAALLTRGRLLDWAPQVVAWLQAVALALDTSLTCSSSGSGSGASCSGVQAFGAAAGEAGRSGAGTAAGQCGDAAAALEAAVGCFAAWVRLGALHEAATTSNSQPLPVPASLSALPGALQPLPSQGRGAVAATLEAPAPSPPPPTAFPLVAVVMRACISPASDLAAAAAACMQVRPPVAIITAIVFIGSAEPRAVTCTLHVLFCSPAISLVLLVTYRCVLPYGC